MKYSTKGRYGLRAMVDLAVYSKGRQVALGSIAERQKISVNYLEQVFSALRKAGLIKSVKGAQGGYILVKEPDKIKAGEILRVLEGPLSLAGEEEQDINSHQISIRYCIKVNVWDKMNEAINKIVDSYTLENLAEAYRRLNDIDDTIYYI